MEHFERDLAKCQGFDFGLHNGCAPVLLGAFHYETGGAQGLGLMIDSAFLVRLLAVFKVEALREVNGRFCWVTHSHCRITKIEPLQCNGGRPFDIEEWSRWTQERYPLSPHELLTGEKPPRRQPCPAEESPSRPD